MHIKSIAALFGVLAVLIVCLVACEERDYFSEKIPPEMITDPELGRKLIDTVLDCQESCGREVNTGNPESDKDFCSERCVCVGPLIVFREMTVSEATRACESKGH